MRALAAALILMFSASASAGQAHDDLSVYWQFTSLENIRSVARENADRIDGDPERVMALWFKAGGVHIIMTTHPPKEPSPRYTVTWWSWIRQRAEWFGFWLDEYDHALRDSATHPKEIDP